ncbi:hypothetical protein JHK87_036669 [Glycine soja]|nr:hypothetical protein JHK87_036669 [Glycine soja]
MQVNIFMKGDTSESPWISFWLEAIGFDSSDVGGIGGSPRNSPLSSDSGESYNSF